jgi:outer membrane protein OmpA-like peptidoglycan-associated protein
MKHYLSIITLFVVLTANSQSYKATYATELSNRLNFVEAYPVWLELSNDFLQKKKGNWDYLRKTAEAARQSEHFEDALKWNNLLIENQQGNEEDYLQTIELNCLLNRHSQIVSIIDAALIKFPNSTKLADWKKNAPIIIEQINEKSEYKVELFSKNKSGEEFAAYPFRQGLIYVSNQFDNGFANRFYGRTGQYFTDLIYIENLKSYEEELSKKKTSLFKDVSWDGIKRTNPHDGPISFSSDLTRAYITTNQTVEDKVNSVKFSRLQLKMYVKRQTGWIEKDVFPFNSEKYSTGHAVEDTSGAIIFASDRPGGFGGVDLYKTTFIDGEWTAPVNLGPTINTAKDELFPYISSTGVLYFASNGWPGMGGLDVFYSENMQQNPIHLGSPINSPADDFGFNVNEETGKGFLSSNRNEWKDQIFSISKPVVNIDLLVKLQNCNGKALRSYSVLIRDLTSKSSVVYRTNEAGQYAFKPKFEHNYNIVFQGNALFGADSIYFEAKEDGKFTKTLQLGFKETVTTIRVSDLKNKPLGGVMLNLKLKNGKTIKKITAKDGTYTWVNEGASKVESYSANLINYQDLPMVKMAATETSGCIDTIAIPVKMTPIQRKDFINLDLILYAYNKFELRPESKLELDKLVRYMKERPDIRVELSSHTDSRGVAIYNLDLSNNRSKSCVDYIISKGIESTRIIAMGYGESQLINKCADDVPCTEIEHQQNRRTELKLLLPTTAE